ncbi:hypothetical protein ANN_17940 [Periplaneta americana]|uniref:Uncharacterized protein n=1 Tax=Periplaneta americana TaxID=6978 RepID=A0ABQ8SPH0_PERAM|nr:hypothetical protein ANN_17940 [Periplaneta americana]
MTGLCEGGNEPPGSLKASKKSFAKKHLFILLGYFTTLHQHPGHLASEWNEGDNAGEMSPGSSTESYPAFAHIRLRENPGKNLNQVTCPDRDSNPGHLASQPDALTVTPQVWTQRNKVLYIFAQDRRATCEELSEAKEISPNSIFRILTKNLKKRKISTRWVPYYLTAEQK